MRLIYKLNLVILVCTTFDDRPNRKDMSYKIFLVTIRIYSFLVLLLDLSSQPESLLNNIFSSELSSSIFLILVYALVVSFFVTIEFLFQQIFCFRIVSNFLDIFEQVMNILGLGQLLENSFLVSLKHLLLIFYHLPILIVVITQNIVYFLYC